MRRPALPLVLLPLVFAFALAPAEAKPREAIASFDDVGKDETVVVGRVELVPPLNEHEQRLRGPMSKRYRNKMFLIVDEEYRELTEEPGRCDYKGRIDATLGEDFIVRSGSRPFYVLAGMMMLSIGHGSTDQAYFPGGLKANIKPGDRAVYIGTIRYHRNEFFEITDAKIVDDYARARKEYERRLGKKFPLRKALLRPVRSKEK